MLYFILLAIIILIIIIFIFLLKDSFWIYQPVVNTCSIFNFQTGILDKKSLHRLRLTRWIDNINIKSLHVSKLSCHDKIKITRFIQQHFYVETNNIYHPTLHHIFYWLSRNGLVSFYQKGIITSRPIHVYLKNNTFNIHYVDWLCVDKKYRKSGIAPTLIQTHESNLPIGAISLFKLDGKLNNTISPLVIFKTLCFTNLFFNPTLKHNIKHSKITKKQYKQSIEEWKSTHDFICVPSIKQMMKLIKHKLMFCFCIHNCIYYFKNSCMYIQDNLCITLVAISGNSNLNDLQEIMTFLGPHIYLNIETIGKCNDIIQHIKFEPVYNSNTGFYLYNYYSPTIDNKKVVCIL